MRLIARMSAVPLLVIGMVNQGLGSSVNHIPEVGNQNNLFGSQFVSQAVFHKTLRMQFRQCPFGLMRGQASFLAAQDCQGKRISLPGFRQSFGWGNLTAAGMPPADDKDQSLQRMSRIDLLALHSGKRGLEGRRVSLFSPRKLAAIRGDYGAMNPVVDISAIPLPAALWLFMSALFVPLLKVRRAGLIR